MFYKDLIQKRILVAALLFSQLAISNLSAQNWHVCAERSEWGNVYGRPACANINPTTTLITAYDESGNRTWVDFSSFTSTLVDNDSANKDSAISKAAQRNLLEKELKDVDVSVFPNPAEHIINIVSKRVPTGSTFTLYDSTGKSVISQSSKGNNSMDVSDLAAGFYLLVLRSEDAVMQWKIAKK
jgi:hypothetical protein